jgi:dipeptidyl aminopeptidase/acylaminoacyl peptidase
MPALESTPLVKMEPVTLGAREGHELVCYLGRPRGTAPADRLPMVLLFHGGPWGCSPGRQCLPNRGYAVLGVNYRGSAGFGKVLVNAGNREWAGETHADLIDAVDWALAHGNR